MGRRISDVATALFAEDRYQDYLFAHGFGVEMAEALAELWHRRIREELGIAGEDGPSVQDWFRQGYRGSRYSFGYAACPDLEDQAELFKLIDPRDRRRAHRRVHAPPRAVHLGDRRPPPRGFKYFNAVRPFVPLGPAQHPDVLTLDVAAGEQAGRASPPQVLHRVRQIAEICARQTGYLGIPGDHGEQPLDIAGVEGLGQRVDRVRLLIVT
jgi:hypothetical protein